MQETSMNSHHIIFETVPCPLCGNDDFKVIAHKQYPDGFNHEEIEKIYSSSSDCKLLDQLVKCRFCDLVYINPQLKPEIILNSYAQGSDTTFIKQNAMRIKTFSREMKNLITRLDIQPMRDKRVLDVGCAGGAFPKAVHDLGFAVVGIEPNVWLCQYARTEYDLDIREGTIFNQDLPENNFNIITLWDVLEHLPQPAIVLDKVRSLLKENGYLILTYPDYGSVMARLLGSKWPFLLSVHLIYYTPKTIKKQLNRCGFEIIFKRPYFQTLELGYVLKRASGYFSLFKALKVACESLKFDRIPIRYNMGQTLVVAKKRT